MLKTKIRKITVIMVFLFITVCMGVNAASISGNSTVNIGDTITVTFNFGQNVGGYDDLAVSYNSNVLQYVSGDALNEGVWYDDTSAQKGISGKTYTFKAIASGSAKVVVTSNGVVSANATMDPLGTITAEKLVTVNNPSENNNSASTGNTPVHNTTSSANSNTTQNNNKPATASGNNYLKYLQISEEGLSPNFTKNVTDYSLAVNENVNSIEVLARPEDENATVSVTGNDNIVEGENYIQIRVTAENGYYREYTIVVTKTADKETSNAYLNNLIVEGFSLSPNFQAEILKYDIGTITSAEKVINVIATAKDSGANIEILGADKLTENGKIIVKVTAKDGKTIKTYEIKYDYKEASNEEIAQKEMQDSLKDLKNNNSKKQKAISFFKYLWASIKKNYLLVAMYVLILVEFIQIVVLRRKFKKAIEEDDDPEDPDDSNDSDGTKDILKVEKEEKIEEPQIQEMPTQEVGRVEPPKITLLDEPVFEERPQRHGSLAKADSEIEKEQKENNNGGIKLVDLNKNEGPQDEITFNIFENLNEDDIKRMLEDIDRND